MKSTRHICTRFSQNSLDPTSQHVKYSTRGKHESSHVSSRPTSSRVQAQLKNRRVWIYRSVTCTGCKGQDGRNKGATRKWDGRRHACRDERRNERCTWIIPDSWNDMARNIVCANMRRLNFCTCTHASRTQIYAFIYTWAIDLGHMDLTSNAMSACTLCVPGARPRSHLTRGTETKLID